LVPPLNTVWDSPSSPIRTGLPRYATTEARIYRITLHTHTRQWGPSFVQTFRRVLYDAHPTYPTSLDATVHPLGRCPCFIQRSCYGPPCGFPRSRFGCSIRTVRPPLTPASTSTPIFLKLESIVLYSLLFLTSLMYLLLMAIHELGSFNLHF